MRTASPTLLAVALAAATALAGCGDKKKKGANAPPPDIDGLAALGSGVQIVIGGDIAKLEASRLVRRGVQAMLARDADLKSRVEAIISECQLVPGENIVSFIIGLGEGPSDIVLVVTGAFEENALTACVQKRLTDSGGRLVTKAFKGRTTYKADGGDDSEPVWFALGSKRTLILAGSEAWLQQGLGEGARLTDDAASKALVAAAPSDKTLWATGFMPELASNMLVKAVGGGIEPPVSMTAQLEFKAGIQAELSAEMASEKDAKALKGLHKLQKPALVAVAQGQGLGDLVNRVEVDAVGKALKIRLVADEAQLSDLLATVDSGASSQQNPPSPEPEGAERQGDKKNEGNTPPDGKAPLR